MFVTVSHSDFEVISSWSITKPELADTPILLRSLTNHTQIESQNVARALKDK